jgi:hypothetical protein
MFDDAHISLDNKVNLNSFYNTHLGALSQQTSFLNKVGQTGRYLKSHARRRQKHEIIAFFYLNFPILTNGRVIKIQFTGDHQV